MPGLLLTSRYKRWTRPIGISVGPNNTETTDVSPTLSASSERSQTKFRRAVVSLGSVDSNPPDGDKDMTTATMLLNIGLAAGTTGVIAAAMTLAPNLDRIRLARRYRVRRERRRIRERFEADLQAGV